MCIISCITSYYCYHHFLYYYTSHFRLACVHTPDIVTMPFVPLFRSDAPMYMHAGGNNTDYVIDPSVKSNDCACSHTSASSLALSCDGHLNGREVDEE